MHLRKCPFYGNDSISYIPVINIVEIHLAAHLLKAL